MSQTPARVWTVSRASVYHSLKETPPNTIARRPGPVGAWSDAELADHIRRVNRSVVDAAMLASFNDRMLADIGLTRSDLRDAFAEPPWRDPTAVLVASAQERRAARPRLALAGATRRAGAVDRAAGRRLRHRSSSVAAMIVGLRQPDRYAWVAPPPPIFPGS